MCYWPGYLTISPYNKVIKVTFSIVDYSNYFSCNPESDKLNLVLSGNIPDDILTTNSYILVPIQASRATADYVGTTVVVVDLSNIIEPGVSSPVFASSYYLVTYTVNEDGSDSISGETSITLNDNDYQNTNFSLAGEYRTFFELDYSNNQINLILLGDLPEDVLYNTEFALLTVTATRNGAEANGNTVIVITLPGEQCTIGSNFTICSRFSYYSKFIVL
ncbi:uncharacterized protein LOC112905002 [Agrilus planipennis]|uniref:Uncharacterized protein LOC112905002 n=1 Tax=Agrilus planipennis TaxID=224129 RepID=A0A7F5R8E2_AGRPL|nr:uncharacterized protein LOC112905002 [Agrilus planipennis]